MSSQNPEIQTNGEEGSSTAADSNEGSSAPTYNLYLPVIEQPSYITDVNRRELRKAKRSKPIDIPPHYKTDAEIKREEDEKFNKMLAAMTDEEAVAYMAEVGRRVATGYENVASPNYIPGKPDIVKRAKRRFNKMMENYIT